ncbi:MAG TPA: ABC transporter permease [Solirubrobacteraceae bacterium]|jgi:ABC-2 type transport system permease protein|nr:ABC transporter permease [Solirubrobacteraceae bacterium]
MSSVSATAAAPLRAARFKRPSTLTVYRWELRKLVSQKRTYLGLGLAILPPLIFVIFQNLHTRHDRGGENIFISQITQSGLATPVLMLLFESFLLLPVIASLVAGDVVAAEDGNGTLKTILTRSVDRGQVFAAKALAAASYAIVAVFLSAAVATAAGVASWGFNSVTTYSGTVVSAPKALLLVFAANAVFLIPLLTVACIGVLLSTATRNSAASVVGAVGVIIVMLIVAQIPGLEGLRPYLVPEQFEAWHGLLRTPTDWAPIAHSAWVCALYAVPALVAGYLVFLRRDVAGG